MQITFESSKVIQFTEVLLFFTVLLMCFTIISTTGRLNIFLIKKNMKLNLNIFEDINKKE